MTPDIEQLAARLADAAGTRPRRYQLGIIAWLVLGYIYIGAVIAALLALAVGAVLIFHTAASYIILIVVGTIAAIVRALFFRVKVQDGNALDPRDAPALFDTLDGLRRALRAPPIHRVVVSSRFNAALIQTRAFGLVGPATNTLEIGLPFAMAHTPRHFETVLAHEYAHLSRAHARLDRWIYRMLATWRQLAAAFKRKPIASVVFGRFFAWYVPALGLRSAVLSRSFEYDADRLAAELTSPGQVADALLLSVLYETMLDGRYWPSVWARSDREAEPPTGVFSAGFPELFAAGPTAIDQALAYNVLVAPRYVGDSHPTIAERLAAFRLVDRVTAAADGSWPLADRTRTAADHYFGYATWHRISAALDSDWQSRARGEWQKRYRAREAERHALTEFDARTEAGDALTPDEQYTYAWLANKFEGAHRAIPMLRALLATDPAHAKAMLLLGVVLLAVDDPEGLVHVERALTLDPSETGPACTQAIAYLKRHDATADDIARWRDRAAAHAAIVAVGKRELGVLRAVDQFEAVPIETENRAALIRTLAAQSEIRRAYLVRKVVSEAPDQSYTFLVIERPYFYMASPPDPTALWLLLQREPAVSDLGVRVFMLGTPAPRRVTRALRATPGALIYDRRRSRAVDRESPPRPAGRAGSAPATVHPASEG